MALGCAAGSNEVCSVPFWQFLSNLILLQISTTILIDSPFKDISDRCAVGAVDCVRIKVRKSEHPTVEDLTYSGEKSMNLVKLLSSYTIPASLQRLTIHPGMCNLQGKTFYVSTA